jgi:hypothetical protein
MATTSTSTAVAATEPVLTEPVLTEPERLALAGFLTGYTGLTSEAYALDLRQYAGWCAQRQLRLFQARRADIECFAWDLEARCPPVLPGTGWARARVAGWAEDASGALVWPRLPAALPHRTAAAGAPARTGYHR